ncbi:12231_t:CDS:2, partial [Gigaspora margarita]
AFLALHIINYNRIKTNQVLFDSIDGLEIVRQRQKFLNAAFISKLFSCVVSNSKPNKKIQSVLPFPWWMFGNDMMSLTFAD